MARGPLFIEGYKPTFSGHETFSLRYGWLKKAFDAVASTEASGDNRNIFQADNAIARFGVGKNMVRSIRYWAMAAQILETEQKSARLKTTPFGTKLLSDAGLDPFMEHPATLWLIHWHLAAYPEKTTWFWAFNHFPATVFDRDHLIKGLLRLAKDRGWQRVAEKTVKNDVACFLHTYGAQQSAQNTGHEDSLESPLIELGLIRALGRRDGFRFARGPKTNLGNGVFIFALIDFWLRFSGAKTLSFEAIAYEPGSPGRVFLLEENDVVERLVLLDEITRGTLRWSETAGLKQVIRTADLTPEMALEFAVLDYSPAAGKRAA